MMDGVRAGPVGAHQPIRTRKERLTEGHLVHFGRGRPIPVTGRSIHVVQGAGGV